MDHARTNPGQSNRPAPRFATHLLPSILLFAAALIVIPPWQGALDRIGDAAAVPPVPAERGFTEEALKLLDNGVFWRVEPDYSLFLVRNAEFAARGRDDWRLVTAYGPWAFLFRGYHPRNYVPLVLCWVAVSAVTVVFARHVFQSRGLKPMAATALGLALVLVLSANPRPGLLLVFPFLFLRGAFDLPERRWLIIAGIAVLALLSLVKASAFALSIVAVSAVGFDEYERQRFPRAPLLFAALLLSLWVLAGQEIGWFGPWLTGTWQVTSGYGESEFAGSLSWKDAALLAVGVLLVLFQGYLSRANRKAALIQCVALGAMVWAAAKTSLVRNDHFHWELGSIAMLGVLLVFAGHAASLTRHPGTAAVAIALISVLGISPFLPKMEEFARQVIALANPSASRAASDQRYARDMAAIRRRRPLPPVAGGIDVYGEKQSVAIANESDYQPRPVYQSYIAYTEGLALLNRRHLEGSSAPQWVLFTMAVTDERFPPLDDSLSWPLLLTSYEPAAIWPDSMLMKRRSTPGRARWGGPVSITTKFDYPVAVPESRGALWARVHVERSLLGRAASFLYKSPELRIAVTTASGEVIGGRMIRRIAEGGFLISPIIVGPLGFGSLALDDLGALAPRQARKIVFSTDDKSRIFYRDKVVLELVPVDFDARR